MKTDTIAQKKAPRKVWAKGIALALAVMSIGAYFRYGDFGFQNFYHRHEFFHYYLGSKYDRELGYERLYECVAVAQADSGQKNEVRARRFFPEPEKLWDPSFEERIVDYLARRTSTLRDPLKSPVCISVTESVLTPSFAVACKHPPRPTRAASRASLCVIAATLSGLRLNRTARTRKHELRSRPDLIRSG